MAGRAAQTVLACRRRQRRRTRERVESVRRVEESTFRSRNARNWVGSPGTRKKKLFFLDAHLTPEVVKAGDFDLTGLLSLLEAKAKEIHATRIVFDGVDVLLSLLDNPIAERREIYRIRDWLLATGLTGLVTQKVGTNESEHRYSFLQFMVDCVVSAESSRTSRSAILASSIPPAPASGDEFPISSQRRHELTHRGRRAQYAVTDDRFRRLPVGPNAARRVPRGSKRPISGAGHRQLDFVGTVCRRRMQRCANVTLLLEFRRRRRANRAQPPFGRIQPTRTLIGLLKMYSTRTRGPNVEDQFSDLRAKVRQHNPRCLVVDPLSALSNKIAHLASADAAQQFLDFLKGEGITVVNTSLMDGLSTDEATATGISTIAHLDPRVLCRSGWRRTGR